MSLITDTWQEQYDCQTETLADTATGDDGTRQATVGGVTGDCIIGAAATSDDLQVDGFSTGGDYRFQMLASAFDTTPEPQCAVRIPGVSCALVMKDCEHNNGVYYFSAIDPNAR